MGSINRKKNKVVVVFHPKDLMGQTFHIDNFHSVPFETALVMIADQKLKAAKVEFRHLDKVTASFANGYYEVLYEPV